MTERSPPRTLHGPISSLPIYKHGFVISPPTPLIVGTMEETLMWGAASVALGASLFTSMVLPWSLFQSSSQMRVASRRVNSSLL
jgi:hypothetical protein